MKPYAFTLFMICLLQLCLLGGPEFTEYASECGLRKM